MKHSLIEIPAQITKNFYFTQKNTCDNINLPILIESEE